MQKCRIGGQNELAERVQMSIELKSQGPGGLWHAWKGVAENFHGVQLAITAVGLVAPSFVARMFSGCEDFEGCLKLTLPLTLAVAFVVVSIQAKALARMSHPVYGYIGLGGVALAVAAFLSQLLRLERTMDWQGVLTEAFRSAPNLTFIVVGPFALLNAYYRLYQPGPFLALSDLRRITGMADQPGSRPVLRKIYGSCER